MDTAQIQIRDQQQQSWDKFSAGWKKWDRDTMKFLQPMGDEIIALLNIKEAELVLDVAAGTGEPGLTIAGIASKGNVTGTDVSENMLAIAREHAAQQGLTNYHTVPADISALPFPDNQFTAISCRMGFMFFPDMALAAREMYRVLKPGGRIATAVWGAPLKNPWVTTMMATIGRHISLPAPVPEAPGMFRCARPGIISGLLTDAGFTAVSSKEIVGNVGHASPEKYWENMTEVGAPIVAALSKADEATRQAIHDDVMSQLQNKMVDGKVMLDFSALIIYGEK